MVTERKWLVNPPHSQAPVLDLLAFTDVGSSYMRHVGGLGRMPGLAHGTYIYLVLTVYAVEVSLSYTACYGVCLHSYWLDCTINSLSCDLSQVEAYHSLDC